MIRYIGMLMTLIALSGCGNFLGDMGERMNSNADSSERKQAESGKQRPDLQQHP